MIILFLFLCTVMLLSGQETDIPPQKAFEANIVTIFVAKSELQLSVQSMQVAVLLGVEEVNRLYPNIQFNVKFKNDSHSCFKSYAGALAAEEFYNNTVTAFIGPACSRALDSVSRMASYWNVPIYTAGGVDAVFAMKDIFTTLTRLSFSLDQVSQFILQILIKFQWQHISIFVDESEASETILRRSFSETIKKSNYEIFPIYKEFSSVNNPNYKIILQDAAKGSRIFLLFACGDTVRDVLLEAHSLGMDNGEFVFLAVELLKNEGKRTFSWYKEDDPKNKAARKMFESLMIISVRVPVDPQYHAFVRRVQDIAMKEFSFSIDKNSINPMVGSFYDCVLLYGHSLNKTLYENKDARNGRLVARQIWNSTFIGGLTGNVNINENGDREADYTLSDLDPETGLMIPVAEYFGTRRHYEMIANQLINWPENKGPPLDIPICGFDGNAPECLEPEPFPVTGIIFPILSVIALIGSLVGFYAYKKILLEAKLADLWWKIEWSDIEFLNAAQIGSSLSFSRSHNSKSTPTTKRSDGSTAIPLGAGHHVGLYKGIKVDVKHLNIQKLQVSRTLLIEIKLMREMAHDNLLRFVGLCVTEQHYSIVTDFATRGSLADMLCNEAINIDWLFSCSIITDIAEGMNFIHGSKLEYHGQLKSENCLIDGRFVVKLSNYGLKELMKQVVQEEEEDSSSLLWTAPEHLREKKPRLAGSKKGDVYSFAIILQEIVTRSEAFRAKERSGRNKEYLTPEDIIDRLRMGTTPPFRPEIAQDECPADMLQLIKTCWDENPEARPTFPEIKHKLKRITRGMSSKNFLDNLLSRMEQYANDLESLVEEKTQSLYDEKRKTDELLYQMIPKYVAEELKKGCHIKPEYFESVTIFFSDIVGFTSLSAESTPLQVVDLLNDLYSCFDSIIENFDVYKVETIGDAYMVASGLPIRNGNEHAREIARLALSLLVSIGDFRIRHKPERKLKLRIGIHSGPCVAGVVGLKMPRYCLFGDTVNTASRMESTSEALKIHISQQTKTLLDGFKTFIILPRGEIEVKGKGMMKTYWLESEVETTNF